jgi:prevent-host-death family protein
MSRRVSVRDLRNSTADVVAAVQSGETLVLTVNRQPVADIVPHAEERSPWVPAAVVRQIVEEAGADQDLLIEVRELRNQSRATDPWDEDD